MSVATPIPLLQHLPDVNVSLGVGVDEYALTYDHGTATFVLRAPFAGILATGATVGATAQAQAFTLGVVSPFDAPAADSTTAWQVRKADKTTAVVNVDTTNSRVGIGTAAAKAILHVSAPNVSPGAAYNTFGDAYFASNDAADVGVGGTIALGGQFTTGTYAVLGRFAARLEANTGSPNGYFSIETVGQEGGSFVMRERMRVSSIGVTTITVTDTTANALVNVLKLGKNVYSTGVGAAGLGAGLLFTLETTTDADTSAASVQAIIYEATHETRKFDLVLNAYDTAIREGLRIRGDGSGPAIGFYGVAPIARAVLATGVGATADNIITALQNLGLVKQS